MAAVLPVTAAMSNMCSVPPGISRESVSRGTTTGCYWWCKGWCSVLVGERALDVARRQHREDVGLQADHQKLEEGQRDRQRPGEQRDRQQPGVGVQHREA